DMCIIGTRDMRDVMDEDMCIIGTRDMRDVVYEDMCIIGTRDMRDVMDEDMCIIGTRDMRDVVYEDMCIIGTRDMRDVMDEDIEMQDSDGPGGISVHYSLIFEITSPEGAEVTSEGPGDSVIAGLREMVTKALREEASLPIDLNSLNFEP
ncbi:hypothetical protein KUCAC02_036600, partial [Chaenocephalus aceratus]